MEVDKKIVFSDFLWVCLYLSIQIMEFKYKQAYKMIETVVLVWNSKNMKSYRSMFFALVAKCLKLKDEFTCLTTSPNWNGKKCWADLHEGGRKYCITEIYPVLIHWWVVYANLLLCWSTACFITLLRFTQPFYNTELYPILTHCWGIPYLITLLGHSRRLILCWAIPNPNTLLRYSLSDYVAEQFPISRHTELYPILTHCWGIPNFDLLLR